MTLLNKLKQDNLSYRKARDEDAGNLLTTLVSEAAMIGKNAGNRDSTDEEVLRVIKKFVDNAKETRSLLQPGSQLSKCEREIAILETYMPVQMTEADIRRTIGEFRSTNPGANIGAIMKHLQTNHGGTYDGKLASQIAKES